MKELNLVPVKTHNSASLELKSLQDKIRNLIAHRDRLLIERDRLQCELIELRQFKDRIKKRSGSSIN